MSRKYECEDGWGDQYIPVEKRKKQLQEKLQELRDDGHDLAPVVVSGRTIANTFWGKAWCDHIESYHDYENRLPRGRSYLRTGAVVDLQIAPGMITALVQGSELYRVTIRIDQLDHDKWTTIKHSCAGKIGSLIDLIQGKLSPEIIEVFCHADIGMFPASNEIKLICNCLDYADLCKHLAAVLYGVGARLDEHPELFFVLRGVDQRELFSPAATTALVGDAAMAELDTAGLGQMFGIELDTLDD